VLGFEAIRQTACSHAWAPPPLAFAFGNYDQAGSIERL
jgi:hypothetical protein